MIAEMNWIYGPQPRIALVFQARIQRGRTGGPDPPPPWDLSEVGSRVEVWWVGEGGPKVVFNLLLTIFFWLASLASIIQTYYIYTYIVLPSSILSMERSSFLYVPLIQIIIIKRIQLPILCIHERTFSYFSCPELHDFTSFKTKNFWGRPPKPPHRHIYNIKLPCHLYVSVENAFNCTNYKKKTCHTEYKLVCK